MDFAKPVPPQAEETDLADLVERALHEAKTQTDPADRTVEVTMADVPPVVVDPRAGDGGADRSDRQRDPGDGPGQAGTSRLHAAFDPYSPRVVVIGERQRLRDGRGRR